MSNKKKKLPNIRHNFPKRMQKKLVLLFITIILAFVFLIGYIIHISASNGEEYTKIILNQQRYDSRVIPFKRGDILDRNGTKIATSEKVYAVILDARVLLSGSKDEAVIKKMIEQTKMALEECFGITAEEVDEVLETRPDTSYEKMRTLVPYEQARKFKKMQNATVKGKNGKPKKKYPYINGVWLEESYLRKYPYGTMASDVIGFTVSGNVGNAGMESYYNDVLNGTDGRIYGYLESKSSLERPVKDAINGNTIVSTIDVTLQNIVEKHIKAFNDAHKNEVEEREGSLNTAVIIANPNNGEILAEASFPNYDPNQPKELTAYYTDEQIDAMSDEERIQNQNAIWRNFCVSDSFEPGSTMKPFTIAAGRENGSLNGSETYFCSGSLLIPGYSRPISCHKRDGHGMQTLSDAIANSCNVALMHIGAAVGAEEFYKYQHIFGFGEETGIDLPGESTGLLFNPENIGPVELATSSFGQGFNVTMTQMVAAFSSLINGGDYYEPHIVKQIQDENGNVIENKAPVLRKRTISEETSKELKEYMLQTMTEGTGKNAQVEGYAIGAKTGTAQKIPRSEGRHTLSYMGFAPYDNPEVIVFVVIDEPNIPDQAVSKHVTDLAREIMTEAFPYLNITKAPVTDASTADPAAADVTGTEESAVEGLPE